MLRQWINCLPEHVSNGWLCIAVCGTVIGVVLWVAGARFSRLLIGLTAVTLGGAIGMALPHWLNWTVSGAGPAVAFALVLGVSGYVMQRLWIGMFFGLVLACWAFLVTWVGCRATETISFSTRSPADWWNALPPTVAHFVPYTCGIAMACGLLLALVWPRMGIAAAWSAAGVSLLAALGSAAIAVERPQLIGILPQQLGPQLATLVLLVGIGVVLQWNIAGRLAGNRPTIIQREPGTGSAGAE